MENYGEWDMTIPALPARSRLYSLEPVGIGSPYTESLTSYTIRLAEFHHVSLKDLVTQEIFPLLGKAYFIQRESLYTCNLASRCLDSKWYRFSC